MIKPTLTRQLDALTSKEINMVKMDTQSSPGRTCREHFQLIIDFDNPRMLAKEEHLTKRPIQEAIEIEKGPNNLNIRDVYQQYQFQQIKIKVKNQGKSRTRINQPVTRNKMDKRNG